MWVYWHAVHVKKYKLKIVSLFFVWLRKLDWQIIQPIGLINVSDIFDLCEIFRYWNEKKMKLILSYVIFYPIGCHRWVGAYRIRHCFVISVAFTRHLCLPHYMSLLYTFELILSARKWKSITGVFQLVSICMVAPNRSTKSSLELGILHWFLTLIYWICRLFVSRAINNTNTVLHWIINYLHGYYQVVLVNQVLYS